MARVFIDSHMFGLTWFRAILPELTNNDKIIFSYGHSKKLAGELTRVRDALRFYKQMGALKSADGRKRRDDANPNEIAEHIEIISSSASYKSCSACDDAHIFAIVRLKPTRYIFSEDERMARCRNEIRKSLDRKYCNFIIVSSDIVYQTHRAKIHR